MTSFGGLLYSGENCFISYIRVLCSGDFCYVKVLVQFEVAGFSGLHCGGENCFIKVGVWGVISFIIRVP